MNKKEQGFGAVEALLVIAIVALVGFIGWYLWHANQTASSTKSAAANTTSPTTVVKKTTVHTSNDAVDLVRKTYDKTNTYVVTNSKSDQGQIEAVKDNLSTELYNTLTASIKGKTTHPDPFTCSYSVNSSANSTLGSSANGVATVNENLTFGTQGVDTVKTTKVVVKVDLNTLKITEIVCPQ